MTAFGLRVPERSGGADGRPAERAVVWLAVVAAVFTVAQLVLVVPGSGLGWDETVYVSQYSIQAPPAFFSAPRARGVAYLTAPVAAWTSSTLVLRVFLAVTSGCGLFVALRVWRGLLPTRVLALAGALFAGLWVTLFYGPQAMPNLWVALGSLAAVGCFLRAVRDRADRRALAGLGAGLAVAALMRPLDAVWLAVPLVAAGLVVRRWRRPAVFAALTAGLVVGAGEWVMEAYAHFGGLLERLRLGSEIQGGMGWHWAVDDQVRALDGRALCRPCTVPWKHPATAVWWFALPVAAAGGVVAAARAGRRSTAVIAVAAAAGLAFPYLFLVDYAAPRFLLPAYALLFLPAADFLWWAPTQLRPTLRAAGYALIALALAGHLGLQQVVLLRAVARTNAARADWARVAATLNRLGVRPPCTVTGDAVPIAYTAGCASRLTSGPDASITPAALLAAAEHQPVALVVADAGPVPDFARAWRPVPVDGLTSLTSYQIYLPPTGAAR